MKNDRSSGSRFSSFFAVVFATIAFWLLFLFLIFHTVHVLTFEQLMGLMPKSQLDSVNILVFGIDETPGVQRSDSIILLSLNKEKERVGVLQIPRDTRVAVPGHGMTKINHAFAFGGTPLLEQSVSQFLGLPVDYYIQVNPVGIERIIDSIGGVDIDVPKAMHYHDRSGQLNIQLDPGPHHLNGREAAGFLRYRHDFQGDIGRMKRQKDFLDQISARLLDPSHFFQVVGLVKAVAANVETDLGNKQLIGLSLQLSDLAKKNAIFSYTVPGLPAMIGGISFWQPDRLALQQIIEESFAESTAGAASVPARGNGMSALHLPSLIRNGRADTITVEVLNGSGIAGEAKLVAKALRKKGFRVAWYRDAANFRYPKTKIVNWKGKMEDLIPLARLIGMDANDILIYDRPDKRIDATLVIGNDTATLHQKLGIKEGKDNE